MAHHSKFIVLNDMINAMLNVSFKFLMYFFAPISFESAAFSQSLHLPWSSFTYIQTPTGVCHVNLLTSVPAFFPLFVRQSTNTQTTRREKSVYAHRTVCVYIHAMHTSTIHHTDGKRRKIHNSMTIFTLVNYKLFYGIEKKYCVVGGWGERGNAATACGK